MDEYKTKRLVNLLGKNQISVIEARELFEGFFSIMDKLTGVSKHLEQFKSGLLEDFIDELVEFEKKALSVNEEIFERMENIMQDANSKYEEAAKKLDEINSSMKKKIGYFEEIFEDLDFCKMNKVVELVEKIAKWEDKEWEALSKLNSIIKRG